MDPWQKFLKGNPSQQIMFWTLGKVTLKRKAWFVTGAAKQVLYWIPYTVLWHVLSILAFLCIISHILLVSTHNTHSSQFFIFKCQHPGAFCKEFYFDNRPRVRSGEIPLSSPSAINKRTEFNWGTGQAWEWQDCNILYRVFINTLLECNLQTLGGERAGERWEVHF